MYNALGLIEVEGKVAAVEAVDICCKTAEVTLVGIEKIIGAGNSVAVDIQIQGDVAAVNAALEAAKSKIISKGRFIASKVIPNPHEEVGELIRKFEDNLDVNTLVQADEIIENPEIQESTIGKQK